jgi:hypothetical protein
VIEDIQKGVMLEAAEAIDELRRHLAPSDVVTVTVEINGQHGGVDVTAVTVSHETTDVVAYRCAVGTTLGEGWRRLD